MRVFIFVIKWLKKVLPPTQQSLKLSTMLFDSPDHTNISHVTYGIVYGINFLLDFGDFWCNVKFCQKEKYNMLKC
jgi:hypothetical protein